MLAESLWVLVPLQQTLVSFSDLIMVGMLIVFLLKKIVPFNDPFVIFHAHLLHATQVKYNGFTFRSVLVETYVTSGHVFKNQSFVVEINESPESL